jgi:hypothetical protein
VPFRSGERISFSYLVSQKYTRDVAVLKVLQGGKERTVQVEMKVRPGGGGAGRGGAPQPALPWARPGRRRNQATVEAQGAAPPILAPPNPPFPPPAPHPPTPLCRRPFA